MQNILLNIETVTLNKKDKSEQKTRLCHCLHYTFATFISSIGNRVGKDVRHLHPGWRTSPPETEPIIGQDRADLFPPPANARRRRQTRRMNMLMTRLRTIVMPNPAKSPLRKSFLRPEKK